MGVTRMNISILLGVFTLAYCGFLYQTYAPQQAVKATIAQTSPAITSREQAYNNLEPDSSEINTATLTQSTQIIGADTLHKAGDSTSVNYEQYRARSNSAHQNHIQPAARQLALQTADSRETIKTTTDHQVAYINGSTTQRVASTVSNPTAVRLQTESDNNIVGYEFLPDGSSQQDVATSSSGNPRVYTIKDYQKADISCEAGYGETSAHNKLIRELKGC